MCDFYKRQSCTNAKEIEVEVTEYNELPLTEKKKYIKNNENTEFLEDLAKKHEKSSILPIKKRIKLL